MIFKTDYKKGQVPPQAGQSAIELAIFGAIVIYIIGTIVSTALSNSYSQNNNFKAMRMALLSSWQSSSTRASSTPEGSTARNNASVLFVEDRLSPDFNKYGDLDRTPYIASGSGSFTYMLDYPITQKSDVTSMLPVMDVYINGQYFPLTTAAYVSGRTLKPPTSCPMLTAGPFPNPSSPGAAPGLTPAQCLQNQCLRQLAEWIPGGVNANSFAIVVPPPANDAAPPIRSCTCTADNSIDASLIISGPGSTKDNIRDCESCDIFNRLATMGSSPSITSSGQVITTSLDSAFQAWFDFSGYGGWQVKKKKHEIEAILGYSVSSGPLFFAQTVNIPQTTPQPNSPSVPPYYPSAAPVCNAHPCMNAELSQEVILGGIPNNGSSSGDLMFNLQRLYPAPSSNNPPAPPTYSSSVPWEDTPCSSTSTTYGPGGCNPSLVPSTLRSNMSWQWYATSSAGNSVTNMIQLDPSKDAYPQWDIDGRLKVVTIYDMSMTNTNVNNIFYVLPTVSYEDFQGGDIDTTWDSNSCTPKPGLQNDAQVYTITSNGTYLQVKEGKLYNPETGQFVRSINQRDNIDLIQRKIQLSNNTGRYCAAPTCQDGSTCGSGGAGLCSNNTPCIKCSGPQCQSNFLSSTTPVTCVDGITQTCFDTQAHFTENCVDANTLILYVRSALQDRRGYFWKTNATGQLEVH